MTNEHILSRLQSDVNEIITTSSSATSPLSYRTNPLSAKVTSVLSASYTDPEIRDALSLLDQRGLNNTAETRRQLRLDVQKEVIESNGVIIQEFGHVAEQLKRIGLTIASLNHGCEEMKRHITAAHQETAPVLQEASDLLKRKEHVEAKQQLLTAFNSHFNMTNEDIATLTSTVEPVNDHFFIVLARAKKIQSDCEILLGTENQRLGLEIMDQVSKNLNGAFQKLYRWVQRDFKSLNLENPQISASIRRSLRVLAERPSLFQGCLDFFAEAREHILSDTFYTALTGTSPSGEEDPSVNPIELAAHDPLRYVGDMLAWTHSATVSEREALEVLFISDGDEIAKEIQAGRENESWKRISDDDEETGVFDGLKALNELVDRDVIGVSKVLRQRIGQVIQSHEETIMVYKIANLLNFYKVTFMKLLGSNSILLGAISNLETSALEQFRALMRDHVAGLQAETQQLPLNLAAPDFLHESLKQLTSIMKSYDSSFTLTASKEAGFQSILVEAFDPFIKACFEISQTLTTPEREIFAINCLLPATSTLAPFDFVQNRLQSLQSSIETYATAIIDHQYSFLLRSTGLQPLLLALAPLSSNKESLLSIRSLDAFQPDALLQASQTLDDFLPSALMDAMEELRLLQSSKVAREVTEEAAERYCDDFERVEDMLIAADEAWEAKEGKEQVTEEYSLRSLFPRTSGEIRVLLS